MQFKNKLLVDVTVETIKPNGHIFANATIHVRAGHTERFKQDHSPGPGDALRVLFTQTGAVVCHKKVKAGDNTYRVSANNLQQPHELPEPTFDEPGSQYLVGQGLDSRSNIITRERWWQLSPSSVTLAPNESRTWTMTFHEGVEQSSTSLNTFSTELHTSSSAGWGPVSASLSASLSASSSTQETVSLSNQTTESETRNLLNTNDTQVMTVRVYQLMERITIWRHSNHNSALDQLINATDYLESFSQFH